MINKEGYLKNQAKLKLLNNIILKLVIPSVAVSSLTTTIGALVCIQPEYAMGGAYAMVAGTIGIISSITAVGVLDKIFEKYKDEEPKRYSGLLPDIDDDEDFGGDDGYLSARN